MDTSSRTVTPNVPARAGKRPTLAELYAARFDEVESSVRFFGVPERDAWDVAQDVFVRVHASLPQYDPARPIGPWLKTITYRTAVDYLRSPDARRMRLARTEAEVNPIDTTGSPEQGTLVAQMQR